MFVESYDPTCGFNYRRQAVVDGQPCILEIFEIDGQEEYTPRRDQFMRDGEAFVIVYSVLSRSSFLKVTEFHRQIQGVKESSASNTTSYPGSSTKVANGPTPIIILGNKADNVTEREVDTQEGQELATELGCAFTECSAKAPLNIEEGFFDLVRMVRIQRMQPQPDTQSSARSIPATREGRFSCLTMLRFWRKKVYVPANEGDSEEGRQRPTSSLVNAAQASKGTRSHSLS